MQPRTYYCITVRRFTLRCRHRDWLEETQILYNKVIFFYYKLFLDLVKQDEEIRCLNSQQIMRRLELLTIAGRDKQPVSNPLPWEKFPLYLRRAAINGAVTAAKSFLSRNREMKEEQNGSQPVKSLDIEEDKIFHCAVTFYKGAYRELKENSVELKVWTGTEWTWLHCRLSGNSFPDYGEVLSPCLILGKKMEYLNVPVKEIVIDGRKAKERVQQQAKVCSIQFTNEDTLVSAVILNAEGEQLNVRFFRGGAEYVHRCRQVLQRISDSEKKMGIGTEKTGLSGTEKSEANKKEIQQPFNQKYWMKLKHLSEYYAHNCSRQLVEYCIEQGVGILILPKYSKQYTKYVMLSAGNWSPVHLSNRIRNQLFYKAWKAGIVTVEVNACGCGRVCSVCGAEIRKRGNSSFCENGHQSNRYLNTARNLGNKCLKSFQDTQKKQ